MPTTPQVTPFVTGAELKLTKPAAQESHKGEPVALQVKAVNGNTFSATSLPAGLSIAPATGLITGTPTTVEAPTSKVSVKGGSPETETSTTFVWTILAAEAAVVVQESERPPLALQEEIVFADGTTKRFDADSPAQDRVTGISFKTKRFEGFADATGNLNRRIDLDYPDLGLLNDWNLVGYDGSVAYSGRVTALPRSTGPVIGVQAQGHMSLARDQSFVEIYADRDMSKWGTTSTKRLVEILTGKGSPEHTSRAYTAAAGFAPEEDGKPAFTVGFATPWSEPAHYSEALYDAGAGNLLGALYYNWKMLGGVPLNYFLQATIASNQSGPQAPKSTAVTVTNSATVESAGYLTATEAFRYATLSLHAEVADTGSSGVQKYTLWRELTLYGNHGLTRRGSDPGGFYASDMIADIAQRWAPQLDTSGVQETTLPIPHAVFQAETLPYDAFQTLNAYHRWEMAVYEDKKLLYYPIDLTDYDWEIRQSDPGVDVKLQGDDTTSLANGVIVRYRDVNTGYENRLTPESHSELKDSAPDNPANLHGLPLYTTLSLSVPTTEELALQVGRIYLAEFNQAKAPGSITIQGHIRDRAGHWQQAWKVRSGQRLKITDMANDQVRVVGESDWQHDTKTLTIAVDSSFKRLDAILARLGLAVEASNLSLPNA